MEHHYKSHTILITTWARMEPDGYTPELRISKKTAILQSLKINQTFPTRKQAESYAVEVAKTWIDYGNFDHVKDVPTSRPVPAHKRNVSLL
jgi:hypothetical protein